MPFKWKISWKMYFEEIIISPNSTKLCMNNWTLCAFSQNRMIRRVQFTFTGQWRARLRDVRLLSINNFWHLAVWRLMSLWFFIFGVSINCVRYCHKQKINLTLSPHECLGGKIKLGFFRVVNPTTQHHSHVWLVRWPQIRVLLETSFIFSWASVFGT